ncbi:hypothetical protein BD779DRAFT_1527000 [Infundibulicybe gibba]|nr:hypothetical protein BD779DRAFT_1527000 [Infundibulicybe gibba]
MDDFPVRTAICVLAFTRTISGACPTLPKPLPSATSLPIITALPNPWQFFDGTPVRSTADWSCRKAEIKTLAQEYLYGYYPDHSRETGGKSASFETTLTLPPGSRSRTATFDVNTVAADSTTESGAFWELYSGRDIGVLTAWAWGYHRIIDALIQVAPEIDRKRVGVTAALAAGIFDERVTLSIPMSSGIEGVGPWRFFFEEGGANEKINNIFGFAPYWSTSKLGQFTNPEGEASVTYPATHALYQWLGAGTNNHCDISGYANIQDFMKKIFFNTAITRNYSDITPYTPFTSAFPWLGSAPKGKYA